jgi:hypothetical protein
MHLGKARLFAVMLTEPDPVVPVGFACQEFGAVVKAVVRMKGVHGCTNPHIPIVTVFSSENSILVCVLNTQHIQCSPMHYLNFNRSVDVPTPIVPDVRNGQYFSGILIPL